MATERGGGGHPFFHPSAHAFVWPFKLVFFTLLGVVLVGLLAIVVDWIAAKFVWGVAGAEARATAQLQADLWLSRTLGGVSPLPWLADTLARWGFWMFFRVTHIYQWMDNAARLGPQASPMTHGGDLFVRNDLVYRLQDWIFLAMLRIQDAGVRLAILLCSWPVYLLAYAVGTADGLSARHIRRVCAGRESSALYHRAKYFQVTGVALSWMAYVAAPVKVSPLWFVFPVAVLMGVLARVQWTYLKKYL